MPALFTTRSSPPNVSIAVSTIVCTPVHSLTDSGEPTACPPAARMLPATSSATLAFSASPVRVTPISLTTTFAPSLASPSAMAFPTPWPAPVTIAVLPSRTPDMLSPCVFRVRSERGARPEDRGGLAREDPAIGVGQSDPGPLHLARPGCAAQLGHGLDQCEQPVHTRVVAAQPAAIGVDRQAAARRNGPGGDERAAFALGAKAEVFEEHQRADGKGVIEHDMVDIGHAHARLGHRRRAGLLCRRFRERRHRGDLAVTYGHAAAKYRHERLAQIACAVRP